MSREATILLTLVVYLVVLLAIGLVGQRRTNSGTDFYLAGRRMGPFVASLSAAASSSSAWTLLGVSGFAYTIGLGAVWLLPACVGGFAINWYLVAPRLRAISAERGALTATDVLAAGGSPGERRAIARIASTIVLVSLAAYVASQFQGAGTTLAETFGIAPPAAIAIGAAIVVLYTLLGGFWAVSLTDTLQGLAMAATAIVLPLAALAAIGPGRFVDALAAVPVEGYLSPWRGATTSGAIGFAAGLLGIGLGYPGQPHVVNRFMALRGGRRALVVARRTAIAWAVVVYSGMILLGLCARAGFGPIADGEAAFMHVAGELFPPVVAGVMIAAVLSAVMSTADSQLLVAASSVTHDLGLGGDDDRSLLRRSRVVVLLLSAAAVAAALAVDQTIFERVLFAWSAMGCAFGPLLLVTAVRGPVSARATIAAMLLGAGLSVAAYTARQLGVAGDWAGVWERVVPFAVALGIAWRGSRSVR